MDKIIVFNEKHGNRTFAYENEEDLNKIFFKIFKERVKDSTYESALIDYFKTLITIKEHFKIRQIMSGRDGYEYEGYYLDVLEIIQC